MRENDAISRSELITFVKEKYHDIVAGGYPYNIVAWDLVRIIENFPALDVAPVVHARWIYSGEVDENGNCESNCSHCDAGDAHRPDLRDAVPYCWKCGARIDGEAE